MSGQQGEMIREITDETDAIRINPMIVQLVARESKRQEDFEKKRKSHDEKLGIPADPTTQKINPQRILKSIRPAMEEDSYANDYSNRGICLIIENEEFKSALRMSSRKGSEVDLQTTKDCFERMGFDVHVKRHLPYIELLKLLERVAAMDHSDNDCFVLIVLTHGNEGILYAYDAPFPTQKLWEPFTAVNSPTLAGKPKLIFLQACQGSKMDDGVTIHKATRITATDSFASYKMPVHCDFLIAHSTVSGYYSWRNTMAGSWYMQSLCKIIDQERERRDILSIVTMANRIVSEEYESSSSRSDYNFKKQTPFIYSTLTYKFYLEPKKVDKT